MITSSSLELEEVRIYYEKLETSLNNIISFSQVNNWEIEANALIEKLKLKRKDLEQNVNLLTKDNQDAIYAHDQLPFLKRLFTPVERVSENKLVLAHIHKIIPQIDEMIVSLHSFIDMTPNSPEEKKQYLEEYRNVKKDLQLQKRELLQNMREIRANARTSMAYVGTGGGKLARSLNSMQRASIRITKERDINSTESEKARIDRHILSLDREITRISKIK